MKDSNHKPNKKWVHKDNRFLGDVNSEICSMHNEGKSLITGKFIRALKNKIYK